MDEFTINRIARDLERKINSTEVALEVAAEVAYLKGGEALSESRIEDAKIQFELAVKASPDNDIYKATLDEFNETYGDKVDGAEKGNKSDKEKEGFVNNITKDNPDITPIR